MGEVTCLVLATGLNLTVASISQLPYGVAPLELITQCLIKDRSVSSLTVINYALLYLFSPPVPIYYSLDGWRMMSGVDL